ncbi:aminotransferase [Paucibacter sp. KBW04]|nr:aminotransferase [Paucibacter sp. KBW04]
MNSVSTAAAIIDVRQIPPSQRHGLIFQHFESLPIGAWFDLHSDHEPLPLKQQFQSLWPDQFDWEVLEGGPQQWRLRIGRRPAGKSCCGCCSGAAN